MDYARLHNPARRLGSACSIVNIGGYSGTAIAVVGVGCIVDHLQWVTGDAMLTHRLAFWLFVPMLAFGLWKILRWCRKVRLGQSATCNAERNGQPATTSPAQPPDWL